MKVFVAICIVLTVLTVFAPNSTPSTLRGKPFKSLDSPLTTKTFHLNLGSERDPSLKWRVDYAKQEVQLEVKFKSSDSDQNDWLAFGFSDRGEIKEADLCVFWVDWKYQVHFDDANTNKLGILFEDSEQQNCDDFRLLHEGKSNIAFTYRRKFETCDPTDYDGTTHLVFAQGEGPLLRLTGVNATAARHGMKRVQLLKNLSDKASMAARKSALRTVKEINITMDRYHIEPVETTYLCKIFKLPPEFAAKHHMIQVRNPFHSTKSTVFHFLDRLPSKCRAKLRYAVGLWRTDATGIRTIRYNPVIQEGNEGFVHHMEVFHCEAKYNQKIPDYLGPCAADDKPPEINVCRKVVAAWAMGAEHFVYPEVNMLELSIILLVCFWFFFPCREHIAKHVIPLLFSQDVGLGIGGENFNPFLMLEVHYNNPDLLSNFVDSSGMQLHYTSKLRRFDAGILEVGLEYTPKTGLPPRMRDVFVRGHCIAECTAIVSYHGLHCFTLKFPRQKQKKRSIFPRIKKAREREREQIFRHEDKPCHSLHANSPELRCFNTIAVPRGASTTTSRANNPKVEARGTQQSSNISFSPTANITRAVRNANAFVNQQFNGNEDLLTGQLDLCVLVLFPPLFLILGEERIKSVQIRRALQSKIFRESLHGEVLDCIAVLYSPKKGLPKDGIRVFASQLHTHLTGVRVWTTHSRNGVQLPDINRDNHYSTHYQEIRILKHPVHVLP
ncbi:unnamed protein product, partial [Notodromas monacha]